MQRESDANVSQTLSGGYSVDEQPPQRHKSTSRLASLKSELQKAKRSRLQPGCDGCKCVVA